MRWLLGNTGSLLHPLLFSSVDLIEKLTYPYDVIIISNPVDILPNSIELLGTHVLLSESYQITKEYPGKNNIED